MYFSDYLDPIVPQQIRKLAPFCAKKVTGLFIRIAFAFGILTVFLFSIRQPNTVGMILILFATLNFLILLYYKISIIINRPYSITWRKSESPKLPNQDGLPIYTVIIPLKEESNIIKRLRRAIENIQYPEDKVEFFLCIDENDFLTIEAIDNGNFPRNVRMLLVPESFPFTKGRVMQHALKKAKGTIITVYDAEDFPESDQLLKAASLLNPEKEQICIQGIIKIENANKNILTKLFAAEYSEWFEDFLVQRSCSDKPFGLGGNSYHLKTALLNKVGGFDPFNVTEDAELSARLCVHNVKMKMFNSITYELCPENLIAWMKQRIRWSKGLLITHLSFFRVIGPTIKQMGFSHFRSFWLKMVCAIWLPLSSCVIFLSFNFTIDNHAFPTNSIFINKSLIILLVFQFLITLFAQVYINNKHLKNMNINLNFIILTFATLVYWFMYILAGLLAYIEYVIDPTKWHKTEH